MKKCFICGREYDETKREHAVFAFVNGEKRGIDNIAKRVGNRKRILALCKYCVKAAVVGMDMIDALNLYISESEPLEYEDEQDVEDEHDVETHVLQNEIPAEGFGAVEKPTEDW